MRDYPVISADSHITEHPDTYLAHIESAWKDKAPRMVDGGEKGDLFVIDGMNQPIAMGLVAAAGKPPEEITTDGVRFDALHRGGWDPDARLAEQDRDGVAAEIIYPTVGMLLCNHKDFDYKKACFDAYNRWIARNTAGAIPRRLLGCGQTAMRTPEEGVADLHAIKALGLRGVMMPGNPAEEDYDSEIYNPVWEAAIELDLPLSFHILTTRNEAPVRGPRINSFLSIIRGNQDIMGTLIFGGVFERYPELEGGLRGGGCRLGAALHVPHGPTPTSGTVTGWRPASTAVQAAERVLRRAHLHHLPGRLGGVQVRERHELAAVDVGQRFPAQRLHLALVAGDARRADPAPHGGADPGHPLRATWRSSTRSTWTHWAGSMQHEPDWRRPDRTGPGGLWRGARIRHRQHPQHADSGRH